MKTREAIRTIRLIEVCFWLVLSKNDFKEIIYWFAKLLGELIENSFNLKI
tara:strand:+ start:746 stop:895 length:150 start_codon:yes stop_codon:yes gene_type:complete